MNRTTSEIFSDIKNPHLKEIGIRLYERMVAEEKVLIELGVLYNVPDWTISQLDLLKTYLERKGTPPEKPSLKCLSCNNIFGVELYHFVNVHINRNGMYYCPRCRESEGSEQWIIDCRNRGFSEAQAGYRLSNWDTKKDEVPQIAILHKAKTFVDDFPKVKSLWLSGPTGVGKTRIAATIGVELMKREFSVLFISCLNLIRDGETKKRLKRYSNPQLLIIDEFTYEKLGYTFDNHIYPILDNRYEAGLPTIFTSNLLVKSFADSTNSAAVRLASRYNTKSCEHIIFPITKDMRTYYGGNL